jgi:hypothetical protein
MWGNLLVEWGKPNASIIKPSTNGVDASNGMMFLMTSFYDWLLGRWLTVFDIREMRFYNLDRPIGKFMKNMFVMI